MRQNPLRKSLSSGKITVGAFQNLKDSAVTEIMLSAGLDWVLIDSEHRSLTPETIEDLVRAAQSCGPDKSAMVRVPTVSRAPIQHALEAGADGILVPLVNLASEAQSVADLTHYPPQGTRGLNTQTRASGWGVTDPRSYIENANQSIVVAVQIETIQAVEHLDEIAAVKGIDLLYVGPADLSHSMGITAQFDHPKLRDTISRIFQTGKKNGKWLGVLTPNLEFAKWCVGQGVQLITQSSDVKYLRSAVISELSKMRDDLSITTSNI